MPDKDQITVRYKNSELPVDMRVEDLLNRMTIKEKVRQLDQYQGDMFIDKTHPMMHTVMADDAAMDEEKTAAVIGDAGIGCIHDLYGTAAVINELQRYAVEHTRLGIPILFSEEALHGLVRPACSVFPHAISQGSTWDPEIVEKIGHAIAAETRSFGIHETFGPVLDLAREPRWGRTEETYGEDTCLSSRLGAAMVRGLQGKSFTDSDSILAEPKHFAVHGVPEGGLNTSACSVGDREMFTSFMPIFEAAFKESGAVNAMCSYNSIDGIPCSADKHLLKDVLKNDWGMRGFVRSDLGAIRRLYTDHCTADTEQEAILQALNAGTDMQYYDFPHDLYQNTIIEAVQNGKVSEETLNEAVGRVLRVKFMLGLFETPYTDPALSAKTVRNSRHTALALEAAREEICLLKNKNGTLPLSKNIGTVAVIGPSADKARLGDYIPYIEGFEPVTVLQGIKSLVSPQTEVLYVRGTGITDDEIEAIPSEHLRDGHGNTGLFGEYFNNPDLEGEPVLTRTDPRISFNWILATPDNRITASKFSVRWTGCLVTQKAFSGSIGVAGQDSMRLWIDGQLVIDTWGGRKADAVVPFSLEAQREYDIRLEFCKDVNGREILLGWNQGQEDIQNAVEAARRADVAVLALGDSEKTCGEGVDRSSLDLPGSQAALLKAICETGTPVILVLQNGRPVTFGETFESICAIVEAWYPGEQGGTAIAEVLFGDCNPAGRLPVSFPKTLGQIPVYYNRKRGGSKKYIEEDNQPLFAFGYGLSYTTFAYENLRFSSESIRPDETIQVSFDVSNTGDRSGDEVVQLYLSDPVSSVVRPEKELKKFLRVHLEPGEKKDIRFELGFEELKLLDRDFRWVVEKGEFRVLVGPSSDRAALTGKFSVI